MSDHDGLYHRLFRHPGMVAQVLRHRVAGPWLQLHGGKGKRRDGDMIWRIPRRDGGHTYLLLPLEFQSGSDHCPA